MKKKLVVTLLLFVFITGFCFAESTVHEKLVQVLNSFETAHPDYKGKVYLTDADGYRTTGDGSRTWQQQMAIILERPKSYPYISKRFESKFEVQLPAEPEDMTSEMLSWWEEEIMAQAGKPTGFAHVGGKAQDVSVRNLDLNGKKLLADYIEKAGLGIIYENPPTYYVTIEKASLFHCHIK